MKLVWSPLALQQVRDIARYIARDKPSAAERWVKRLFEAVAKLPDHPFGCRAVPELKRQEIRELIFGNYRVIYSVHDRIQVLVVRHGRRLLDETTELGGELGEQESCMH